MKRVIASIDWNYFNQFESIIDMYMPDQGEGDTIASQAVTAVNKLVYKWYNDGDVYDNTYGLEGWANDLSSYANWLYKHTPARHILEQIYDISTESEYEDLLQELADLILDDAWLQEWNTSPKSGSIYDCDGPFKFEEYSEEDDYDDYEEDYDEEYEEEYEDEY